LDGIRFKQGTLEAQASTDLIALVAETPCAIGYSSLAYATPNVKVVCIAEKTGEPCVLPSVTGITQYS